MRFSRLTSAPVRRGALAVILVGVVVFPGVAARHAAASCPVSQCPVRDVVLWSQPLPGSWLAQDGPEGTVPAQGQAYAAVGHGLAVVGSAQAVSAFAAATGVPRWTATLAGLPPGAAVSSVRSWPGVVTVGVDLGDGTRREVVLADGSGRQLASYRAATSGGAVQAGRRRTVVVGPTSVVSYANATGKATWRIRTGTAQQAWRVSRGMLFMTVSAHGELGTSPVTAVREISLHTGRTRLIRPEGGSFAGTLSAVTGGVLVFAGSRGLTMYSFATGRLTGQRSGAVVEGVDPVSGILYADIAGALRGIDPVTGLNAPGTFMPGTAASYNVRAGVALGLDQGGEGSAWGYSLAQRKVIWTTRALPWPHYFVDLSGLGGSSDPVSGMALIATCAQAGQAVPGGGSAGQKVQVCQRPRLVAIGPRPQRG